MEKDAPQGGWPAVLDRSSLAGADRPVTASEWNARSERRTPGRRTALVLSGGIAKGVYEAGAISGLFEQGFTFDVICGTSIGAINGAFVAQGDAVALGQTWGSIAKAGITTFVPQAQQLDDVYRIYSGSDIPPLKWLKIGWHLVRAWAGGSLLRLTGAYDPSGAQHVLAGLDLTRLQTPFMCAATNVDTGRAEAFYAAPAGAPPIDFGSDSEVPVNPLRADNAVDVRFFPEVVRASGALPGAFSPVALPGFGFPADPAAPYRYGDGGVTNNTPVRLARKLGVTDMICVFLSTGHEAVPRVANLVDILSNLYTANQVQLLDDEILLAIQTRNSLGRNESNVTEATTSRTSRLVNIYQIRPVEEIAVSNLGFDDQAKIDAGFVQGLTDGRKLPAPYAAPDV